MKITKNKFVSVSYDLHVGDEDETPELMESATEEHPLQFIFGMGMMLPAFEENILHLETGSTFEFSLTPEQGYGEYVEDHVVELPKTIFETDGKFDAEYIVEGVTLPMINANGERMNGSVLEVKAEVVVMDFNHPLAGETLHFNGKVLDVHEATPQEIAAITQSMSGGCGCSCSDCSESCS
jgi:FKBP-type peptidyl-prolyl cis-trans isomerase SlyD